MGKVLLQERGSQDFVQSPLRTAGMFHPVPMGFNNQMISETSVRFLTLFVISFTSCDYTNSAPSIKPIRLITMLIKIHKSTSVLVNGQRMNILLYFSV